MGRRILIIGTILVLFALPLEAQDAKATPATLRELVNKVIEDLVVKADLRQDSRQTEAPAGMNMSTAVTDRAAASSLVSTAFGLAGLSARSNDEKPDDDSAAISVSAYSLYAAARGADPLNPAFYLKNKGWRRFWLTLGYEKPSTETASEATEKRKLIGAKYLFFSSREATQDDVSGISDALNVATKAYGDLQDKIFFQLYQRKDLMEKLRGAMKQSLDAEPSAPASAKALLAKPEVPLPKLTFTQSFGLTADTTPEGLAIWTAFQNVVKLNFPQVVAALTPDQLEDLEHLVESEIAPFLELEKTTVGTMQRINRAPQLAFQVTTKQSNVLDDYEGKLAFDYGLADRVSITANGAFFYTDSQAIGADKRGFDSSVQFEFKATRPSLASIGEPVKISAGMESKWTSGNPWMVRGQAKISFPLAPGIILPVTFDVINANESGQKTDYRAKVGFAFDFARLASALTGKP